MHKRLPELDARLSAVVGLVPSCRVVADIGADHGHVACHLLAQNCCERMVVADVSPHALARAEAKLRLHGLADRAQCIVADGLSALDAPVDAVIIAGMGAQTLVRILDEGWARLGKATLILQANREPETVRTWLAANGWQVAAERLCRAAGRYYVVMRAMPGSMDGDERLIFLGQHFLEDNPPEWQDYLKWRHGVLRAERPGIARLGDEAIQAHARRLRWIEEAMQ